MTCESAIDTINNTFAVIRETSFTEKKEQLTSEQKINGFLDRILDLKKNLNEKCEKIEDINVNLESLTWLNNIDDNCLRALNDLISSARELHGVLARQYANLNYVRSKGIAKAETIRFKKGIDDLKDITADLDAVFFYLPVFPGFTETTKELSLV